jgi:hypothetical protein
MNRRFLIIALIASFFGGVAMGAKTYRYKCPKCKLIQEYGTPGVKKCPNDGRIMTRQN